MDTKKILVLVGVALLVFFLVTEPQQSADIVKQLLGVLKDAAEAIITFVKSVFSDS